MNDIERVSNEESRLNTLFHFNRIGMKRKWFTAEDKLLYLNDYEVYEMPVENHNCYELIGEKIGSGAFGEVIKVKVKHGTLKDKFVAIKRCKLEGIKSKDVKLLNEIIANARISNAIFTIYWQYWIEYENKQNIWLNLCMDLADESLEDWLKRSDEKRPFMQNLNHFKDICYGLWNIHSRKIIHRDIKPANILISEGKFKIADFGVSSLPKLDYDLMEELYKTNVGTPIYKAPEINRNEGYDYKTDVFSLGLIFFQMIIQFKNEEYSKDALLILKGEKILPDIFPKECKEEGNLIIQMVDEDPKKRPSMKEIIVLISSIIEARQQLEMKRSEGDILEDGYINEYIKEKINQEKQMLQNELYFFHLQFENYRSDPRDTIQEIGLESIEKGEFGETFLRKSEKKETVIKMIELSGDVNRISRVLTEIANISHMKTVNKIEVIDLHILRYESSLNVEKRLLYLEMNICDFSLANWLQRKKTRDISIAAMLFENIAEGLLFLRNFKIVHRNLKPSNILLGKDDHWKISDYGYSSLRLLKYQTEAEYFTSLKSKGIPIYAAPEQLKANQENENIKQAHYIKHKNEFQIDIFSFGCICVEFLTIFECQESTSLCQALDKIRNENEYPTQIDKSFGKEIMEFIQRMTELGPNNRPAISEVYEMFHTLWANFHFFYQQDATGKRTLRKYIKCGKGCGVNLTLNEMVNHHCFIRNRRPYYPVIIPDDLNNLEFRNFQLELLQKCMRENARIEKIETFEEFQGYVTSNRNIVVKYFIDVNTNKQFRICDSSYARNIKWDIKLLNIFMKQSIDLNYEGLKIKIRGANLYDERIWSCNVSGKFTVTFLSDDSKNIIESFSENFAFNDSQKILESKLKLNDILNPENGYLKDGFIIFYISMQVDEPKFIERNFDQKCYVVGTRDDQSCFESPFNLSIKKSEIFESLYEIDENMSMGKKNGKIGEYLSKNVSKIDNKLSNCHYLIENYKKLSIEKEISILSDQINDHSECKFRTLKHEKNLIKNGNFSEVICQKFQDETQLALKIINLIGTTDVLLVSLLKEIKTILDTLNQHDESNKYKTLVKYNCRFNEKMSILEIQMELGDISLYDWMNIYINREVANAFKLFRDIQDGLTMLHYFKIVHRDLKPTNIFFSFQDRWKISDYALSKLRFTKFETEAKYYQSLTEKEIAIYAAPEQLQEGEYDKYAYAIDVFSFGCICMEYLSCSLQDDYSRFIAFNNLRENQLLPEELIQSNDEEVRGFVRLIKKMTQRNASFRPTSLVVGNEIIMINLER